MVTLMINNTLRASIHENKIEISDRDRLVHKINQYTERKWLILRVVNGITENTYFYEDSLESAFRWCILDYMDRKGK